MATMPMQSMPTDQAAPTDPAMQDKAAGYCICIHVDAEGALSVGVEDEGAEEAQESPEGMGAMENEQDEYANFTPAKNIKQALTMALEIYHADGNMPESSPSAMSEGFKSGYEQD